MPMKVFHLNGSEAPKAPGGPRQFSQTDLLLRQAVGAGATLTGPDVVAVQKALNETTPALGGPVEKLVPDGKAGRLTINAIENFQRHHFGFKDGRVDLFGKTHAKLSSSRPAKLAFVNAAKEQLSLALDAIRAAEAKLLLAQTELLTGNGLSGNRNLNLVDRHFDVMKSENARVVIEQLKRIYDRMLAVFARPGGLWGVNAFEADPFTENAGAFTFWGGFDRPGQFGGWQRLDAIYICESYQSSHPDYKIFALVHELAHFVGPASGNLIDDHAFGRSVSPAMKQLLPVLKQRNAQSFANFAFEAKTGREAMNLP